jgi:UDP-glucose 4-epimerase
LITGGAGFIGSNLARYLLAAGSVGEVRVLDDFSTGYRHNLDGVDAVVTEGSILDYPTLLQTADGVDAIVHLAAIPSVPRSIANPRASHEANTTGTLNVLEAARERGVQQVIVASSSSVYGSNPKLPKSEYDWTRPMSPYAVSKLATEGYALAYQFSYGLKTLAFRFFNVFGPGQAPGHAYAAVVPKFLDAALRGEPVEVHGDGLQSRDFTFVETVCAVIEDALVRTVHSTDPVNLAFGTNTTLLALLGELESQLGHPIERKFVESRVGDVRASQADPSRLLELFPKIEPTPLSAGVAATVAWFRQQSAEEGPRP